MLVLNFPVQINEQFSVYYKNGFGSAKIRAISSSLNGAKRTPGSQTVKWILGFLMNGTLIFVPAQLTTLT